MGTLLLLGLNKYMQVLGHKISGKLGFPRVPDSDMNLILREQQDLIKVKTSTWIMTELLAKRDVRQRSPHPCHCTTTSESWERRK